MRAASFFLLVAVLGILACSPQDGAVEGEDLMWAIVSDEPLLVLGSEPGQVEQQFDQIASVLRLRDGRIVVADQSRMLRFFDTERQLLGVSGRRGAGPGEYEMISLLKQYRTDSLVVWDVVQQRATILDDQGVVGRIVRLQPDSRFPPLVLLDDNFADGSLLAMAGPPREEERGTGRWAVLPLLRLSSMGVVEEAIGEFPLHRCEREEANCAAKYKEFRAVWTVGGNRLYYARPDRSDIMVFDLYGTEVGRIAGPPQGVSSVGEMPAYADLLPDALGNLWAKAGSGGSDWFVFNPSGEYVGRVQIPKGLTVHQIGQDFVLGVERDELDVQHVIQYRLSRAGRT